MTKILSKEIALNGRWRTASDGAQIGANDFQVLRNIRYTEAGIRGVAGQTKINTTPLANATVNGIHFRKNQPSESHIVVDGADNKCYQNVTAIPGAGDFSATALYSTAGTQRGRYAIAPTGMLARCTGDKALLYGGTAYRCSGFIDYPLAANIYDYSEQVANTLTSSDQLAIIHATGAGPYVATFYIGSILPAAGFNLVMQTVNPQASIMTAYYWNGSAWTTVAGLGTLTDGTSGLTASGSVTFPDTSSVAKPTVVEKSFQYWTKVTVSAAGGNFSGVPKISNCTVVVPMQPVKDIWDGVGRTCAAFILNRDGNANSNYDFTSNVYSAYYDPEPGVTFPNYKTFIDIQGTILAAAGYLLFGFPERISGLMTYLAGDTVNTAAATIDLLDYWNGSAWTSLTTSMVDGTLDSTATKSMSKTGWITWDPPVGNLESKQTGLPGHQKIVPPGGTIAEQITDEIPLYYYRLSWSATLAACRLFYVQGIPAQFDVKGCTFPVQHAGRLFLCDFLNEDRNSVRYSAFNKTNVFNGEDSDKIPFGGDEALVAGASLYNRFGSTETSMLVLCKRGETWGLSGDEPSKWTKFQISDSIGCIAPQTMVGINIPSKEVTPGVSQNAAVWLSQRGLVLFSGASFTYLSDDIGDLFDSQKSTYIGDAALATCTGFHDPKRNEYHLLIPDTNEYVYSFRFGKWFEIARGSGNELSGGFPVQDTNGISHIFGYDDAGYLYRLENGTTFDGDTITQTFRHGDMALPEGSIMEYSQINWFLLIGKVGATSVTHNYYVDSALASSSPATISAVNSGKRLINVVTHGPDQQVTFHGNEFISTDPNFEPMFIGYRYTVFPREAA